MPVKFAPPRRRVDYCHRDPVVLAFADMARIRRPGAAHQVLWGPAGIRSRAPHAITAFLQKGPDRLAHWYAPMRVAMSGVGALPLTPCLELDVALLDASDDVARIEYQRTRTDNAARRLVAAIDRTIEKLLAYRRSLVTKHRLEGQ
jgi:hypothetical protein